MNQLGYWTADRCGLPVFAYTGAPVKLPADPWFLLGNYRLTLFTHVSGEYELISGQRAWARINQGEGRNSGRNAAEITINGKKYALTGMQSLAADPSVCRRSFGCGFAEYVCRIGEVEVRRNLSVKPSATPYDGASGFLLTVTVKNNGADRVECAYTESVGAHFEEIRFQTQPQEKLPLRYQYAYAEDAAAHAVRVAVTAVSDDPLRIPEREAMATVDAYPPALFLQGISEDVALSGDETGLAAHRRGPRRVQRLCRGLGSRAAAV